MYSLKLYFKMISIVLSSQLQYRTTFILSTITYITMPIVDLSVIFFYFMNFEKLGNWNSWEVAIIYSVTSIGFGLAESLMRGFDIFPYLVQNGHFDRMLLRPVNIILQIIAIDIPLYRLNRVMIGIIFIIMSWIKLDIPLNLINVIVIISACIGSFLIYTGIYIVMGAISFITVKPLSIFNLFSDGTREMARFPVSAYPKGFARFYIYIIPVACTTYFPVSYVLRKQDIFNTSNTFKAIAPVFSCVFLAICFFVWLQCAKRYTSTGN